MPFGVSVTFMIVILFPTPARELEAVLTRMGGAYIPPVYPTSCL